MSSDSEDEILEPRNLRHVGVDDIDIIQRTLRCHRLPPVTPSTTSSKCYEELSVEEEALPIETEVTSETTRAQRLYDELECLKRRIQMMQLALKERRGQIETNDTSTNHSAEEDENEYEAKCKAKNVDDGVGVGAQTLDAYCAHFDGSDEQHISWLQKEQHMAQCKLNSLIEALREMRSVLRAKRKESCQRTKQLRQIEISIDDLMAWKRLVESEAHVCDDRYEYIRLFKALFAEAKFLFQHRIESIKVHDSDFLKTFKYEWHKGEFEAEMKDLTGFTNDLRNEINRKLLRIMECIDEKHMLSKLDESETVDFGQKSPMFTEVESWSEGSNDLTSSESNEFEKADHEFKLSDGS